jgi:ABC-type enterochelin transport system substrate-binding protein
VFGMFERVRFETVNQATNENIVISGPNAQAFPELC